MYAADLHPGAKAVNMAGSSLRFALALAAWAFSFNPIV